MEIPDYVRFVLDRLRARGFSGFLVGGCVRDALMGKTPADYDIAVSCTPAETEACFADCRVIGTGLRHGTVTVVADGHNLELTTFREDGAYLDHRRPENVRFTRSLEADLSRRDFTVNAMAYSTRTGLVDPFGGEADLRAKRICCVGDPAARFREDALRILRCIRFSSVLGFAIDPATAAAARENRALLRTISAERVAEELKKLVCGADVRRVVLEETDILGAVLPELLPMRGFDQRNKHHVYDVLEHCAAACEAVPPEPVLRLAALLHDVGKPDCFFTDAEGVGHFYGHAERGAEITDGIGRRLRLDNESRERITLLVRRHDMRIDPEKRSVLRCLRRFGAEFFFQLLEIKRADTLAHAPGPKMDERLSRYAELEALARDAIAEEACFSLRSLAVNGRDLLDAGYAPGPALGQALETLLDAVTDGRVPNEKAALLAFLAAQGTAEDGT